MDESDLEPEEPLVGLGVDQLDPLAGERGERGAHVGERQVLSVVISRPRPSSVPDRDTDCERWST